MAVHACQVESITHLKTLYLWSFDGEEKKHHTNRPEDLTSIVLKKNVINIRDRLYTFISFNCIKKDPGLLQTYIQCEYKKKETQI